MINTDIKRSSIKDRIELLKNTKKPRFSLRALSGGVNYCYVCGQKDEFLKKDILDDHLTKTWGLNRTLRKNFDNRESTRCINCKASMRSNFHARAILETIAPDAATLDEAIKSKDIKKLKIAEVNACGALHERIKDHPKLYHSEYDPKDKTIRHEDITNMSYEDEFFDLVLSSETLEHVPEWKKGLADINRVLKTGGYHIFTVPAIMSRKTRTRAVLEKGKIKNILEKSFHGCTRNVSSDDYIVCSEFGSDILETLKECGFDTKVYYTNVLNLDDPNVIFVSKKVEN